MRMKEATVVVLATLRVVSYVQNKTSLKFCYLLLNNFLHITGLLNIVINPISFQKMGF